MAGENEISIVSVLGTNPEAEIDRLLTKLDQVAGQIVSINDLAKTIGTGGNVNLQSLVTDQGKLVQMQKDGAAALTDYNSVYRQTIDIIAQNNGHSREVAAVLVKVSQSQKELQRAELEAAKAGTESARQRLIDAKAQSENAKLRLLQIRAEEAAQREANKTIQSEADLRIKNAKAVEAENKARGAASAADEREIRAEQTRQKIAAKGTQEQVGLYDQLRKAYNEAAKAAKEIGVAEGINSAAFKAAATDAKRMYDTLYAVESAVGQNQRGVGQYERGSAGLSNAVQQILREAPSAANSLNTFFLAISNNLPILFDEIGRVNKQLGALKAEAEASNIALQSQTTIQKGAATAAQAADVALSTQVESIITNIGASKEQAAALRENITQTVASGVATGENTAVTAANTEQLAINAGATAEEAAALRVQTEATALATQASIRQTAALEAQTIATAEATATAKAAPGVLKGIVGSLLSYNTALTLGVLALTLWGGKLVDAAGALFGIIKISKEAEKAAKEYAESLKSIDDAATRSAASEVAHLETLINVTTGINRIMAERKAAALELQKTYPERFANLTQEAILEGRVADAVARTRNEIYARARSLAAEKKFGEAESNIYDLTLKLKDADKAIADAQAGIDRNKYNPIGNTRAKYESDKKDAEALYQSIADRINKLQVQQSQFRDDADKAAGNAYGASQAPEGSTAALRKKISDLKAVIELQKIGSAEQITSTKQLVELEKQLKEVEGKTPKGKAGRSTVTEELAADRFNIEQRAKLREEDYKTDAEEQRKIFEDTQQSLDARLDAYRNYSNDLKLVVLQNKDAEILAAKNTLAEIDKIKAKGGKLAPAQQKLLSEEQGNRDMVVRLEKEKATAIANIDGDAAKKTVEIERQAQDEMLQAIVEGLKKIDASYTEAYAKEKAGLDDSLAKGLISRRRYNEEMNNLNARSTKEIIAAQIENLQTFVPLFKEGTEDAQLLNDKIAELAKQLSKLKAEVPTKGFLGFDDKQLRAFENALSYTKSLISEISQLQSNLSQKRINEIDREIEKRRQQADADVEAYQASAAYQVASEQERNEQIADIHAQARAEEQRLEQEKTARQRRNAQFQKGLTVALIEVETALAVIKALNDPSVPNYFVRLGNAISAGVLGEAKALAAASAPIPEYADGIDDHPGGPAIVGDGGRREVGVLPDGTTLLTPAVPTLVDWPAHSIVYKSVGDYMRETHGRLYAGRGIGHSYDERELINLAGLQDSFNQGFLRMERAIKDQPRVQNNFTSSGLEELYKTGESIARKVKGIKGWGAR